MRSTVARNANPGVARQAFALRSVFPDTRPTVRRGYLSWEGKVRPHALADEYLLQLTAHDSKPARVFVVAPQLRPNSEGLLPHVWGDGSLCLNRFGDWSPGMLMTDTVIPWACEWLVAYEFWLATNSWLGDGPEAYDFESQRALLHVFDASRRDKRRA